MKLDTHDKDILKQLQKNGRLTNQELSEIVGLSASQISRRRIQLEQSNMIVNYSAKISPLALDLEISSLIEVTLASSKPESVSAFYHTIKEMSAIIDIYKTTGSADYYVKVAVPKLSDLSDLLSRLAAHSSVGGLRTSVVLERLKENGEWL